MIHYYIDPGAGFVFVQNTNFLWGIILGFLGGLFFFFRPFFKLLKKFIWIIFILSLILVIGGIIMYRQKDRKKVIILGIDAMDPELTEKLMGEGRLPNFSVLKTKGSYAPLSTTIPSESVVAWTSFATGLNPGAHGIFDFIMRNPQDYSLYLSLTDSNAQGKSRFKLRKKGKDFWNILSEYKIPSFIYFCPNTFPPSPVFGRVFSGMGVPDITGTIGKFSFYTTKGLSAEDKNSRGRVIQVRPDNNIILTELYGPKVYSGNSQVEIKIPLEITLNPKEGKISIHFQKNHLSLKEKTWSSWYEVVFKIGTFKKVYGIVRFYLKNVKPEFELYVSPINFNPKKPPFAISYPYNYSKKLAKEIGLYHTQGMPHDTWALTEDRLDEEAFLEQVDTILNEKKEILKYELRQFKSGLLFFYFDTLDIIQHMFWRYIDHRHPIYDPDSSYRDTIFRYYEKIDGIIGEISNYLDEDTILIVLSDHGFSPFRRVVHLNRWLFENGYLFLKEGVGESKEFFEDVDWSKTKAYALGFGGIYLNRIDREYYGIVDELEVKSLKQKIIMGLRELRDPETGEKVVNNIYDTEKIYRGPYLKDAPDLFVGFNIGFRASWQTALGGMPAMLVEDNKRKWSGDHLIDPTLVAGVIFSNKKIELKSISILDIAPTVLSLFGINKPDQMQ
ncbi:MAG: alkaline phosphatase family protein [Candidatus Omnitrophica bacterium]|nr:alkaline phosphatase family protein [Candidatus Omnitrophota bacterium]